MNTTAKLPGDVIFQLGSITEHRRVHNRGILREIAEAIHEYIGSDMLYLASHEGRIAEGASDCAVIGPWEQDQTERFLDLTKWAAEDRVIALQMTDHEPDTMHRRAELIDESLFRDSDLYKEFHEPMSIGDSACSYHVSPEGTTLFLCAGAISSEEPLPSEVIERAETVLPYVFRAYDAAWKPVPEWARDLRPQAMRILQHVIDGLDDEHIAAHTGLTYHSVRAHLKRLFRLAQVRSRLHLTQAYLQGMSSEDLDREVEDINRRREENDAVNGAGENRRETVSSG